MNRDLGLDDARDRQMHDTLDPDEDERRREGRRRLDSALATVGPLAPARKALDPDPTPADPDREPEQPAAPRKRDWTNVGSPIIRARLDPEQRATLHARATSDGVTPSDVIRSALDAYLDRRP